MRSNLGHLPLGRLYVVINDGYLAQVPGGAGAHLHNTDRYNTTLQDQTARARPAADWRVADRCDECRCATANRGDVQCICVAKWTRPETLQNSRYPSPFPFILGDSDHPA